MSRSDLQTYLIRFGLSDNCISTLTNIFSSEFEISKAANNFQSITRKKTSEASHLAKQALQELKNIAHNAEAFGVTVSLIIVDYTSCCVCEVNTLTLFPELNHNIADLPIGVLILV